MQFFVVFCACVVSVQGLSITKVDDSNGHQCGVEASTNLIHHNPWLVFLEYYNMNGERDLIRCGGTLIGSRHVATAAHCVKKVSFSRLVVRLGEYDLATDRDCVGDVCSDDVVRIDVIDVSVPPGYDGSADDIAILELKTDAPYTDFIRPICLPTEEVKHSVTYTAAGWGELTSSHIYSHVKKIIPLPSWTTEDCRVAYKNLNLPQKIICAGGEKGIDTCRGDSGGPLTLNMGRIELRGVTSSGNVHCGAKGSPGIYTSVTEHLDWINEVLNKS